MTATIHRICTTRMAIIVVTAKGKNTFEWTDGNGSKHQSEVLWASLACGNKPVQVIFKDSRSEVPPGEICPSENEGELELKPCAFFFLPTIRPDYHLALTADRFREGDEINISDLIEEEKNALWRSMIDPAEAEKTYPAPH